MKKIIWVASIFILVIIFIELLKCVAPGNYAFAEIYEFKIDESKLIDIVENLKKSNPEFIVPIKNLKDESHNNYFHVYFYYLKENQIVYFLISSSPNNNEITQLAFVSINDGLILGHWNDINDKLSRKENKAEKKKFEERILNKLGMEYKDNGYRASLW